MANNSVFSDFELDKIGIKIAGETEYVSFECIGSGEEEMETKVITKSCRGVVKKKKVKPTGNGTFKLSAHIPWDIYTEMFGMNVEGLVAGVKAYGTNSVHKEFSTTLHITNEDGEEKYKAYPKCVIETGSASKIENGGEEVAEVELEIAMMPDDFGNGKYEALASELTDETVKTKWMTAFDPAMVQSVATV